MIKSLSITIACTTVLLTTTACDPLSLMMGGTAIVGGNATREKGLKNVSNDSWISTKVKAKIYGVSSALHGLISVNVQQGEVLLAGRVPEESWVQEAERVTKEVDGVTTVYNHIIFDPNGSSLKELTSDAAITTHLKSDLLCDGSIKSLNYSIKTEGGIVYVMGIAQSEEELEKALNYARNIQGVEKVVCYAKIKNQTDHTEAS